MAETISKGEKKDGRDEKGRFTEGYAGGPGRPINTNKTSYLNILHDELTEDKWREVIRKAIEDAKGDNAWERKQGREFLAKYVLPQKLDVPIDTEAIIAALLEGRATAQQNSGGQIA